MTLLSSDLFVNALSAGRVEAIGERWLERLRGTREWDEPVGKVLEAMKDGGGRVWRKDTWEREDGGLLLNRGRVVVPRDADLHQEIIVEHHHCAIAGHEGRWKTIELITRNYW